MLNFITSHPIAKKTVNKLLWCKEIIRFRMSHLCTTSSHTEQLLKLLTMNNLTKFKNRHALGSINMFSRFNANSSAPVGKIFKSRVKCLTD